MPGQVSAALIAKRGTGALTMEQIHDLSENSEKVADLLERIDEKVAIHKAAEEACNTARTALDEQIEATKAETEQREANLAGREQELTDGNAQLLVDREAMASENENERRLIEEDTSTLIRDQGAFVQGCDEWEAKKVVDESEIADRKVNLETQEGNASTRDGELNDRESALETREGTVEEKAGDLGQRETKLRMVLDGKL